MSGRQMWWSVPVGLGRVWRRGGLMLAALVACHGAAGAHDHALTQDWRILVKLPDRDRLRDWRSAFVAGLADARASGHGAAVDQLGALLQPDIALDQPMPSPGDYRCRVVKLGGRGGGSAFVDDGWFHCRLSTGSKGIRFAELDGPQRPSGRLFPEADRAIFLGTLVLGDETRALPYGGDPDRNMAGLMQRVEDGRWRLLLPHPKWESTMDVMEIVPAKAGS